MPVELYRAITISALNMNFAILRLLPDGLLSGKRVVTARCHAHHEEVRLVYYKLNDIM